MASPSRQLTEFHRFTARLDPTTKSRLSRALKEIEALLAGETEEVETIIRPAGNSDMAWVIDRHAVVYDQEYGFNWEFEKYVLLGLADYCRRRGDGRSGLWLAEAGGERAGSIGIVDTDSGSAQLRWLIVESWARKLGLGQALVEQALDFCRQQEFPSVFLWTLKQLDAARRLYARFGFRLTEEKAGLMGGQRLVEERWELDLG